jgi:hypothetical protein
LHTCVFANPIQGMSQTETTAIKKKKDRKWYAVVTAIWVKNFKLKDLILFFYNAAPLCSVVFFFISSQTR